MVLLPPKEDAVATAIHPGLSLFLVVSVGGEMRAKPKTTEEKPE